MLDDVIVIERAIVRRELVPCSRHSRMFFFMLIICQKKKQFVYWIHGFRALVASS